MVDIFTNPACAFLFCRCHECNKSFASKTGHQNHMAQQHAPDSEKKFKCNVCTRSFAKPYLLAQHLRLSHTAEPQYFYCDICDKRCAQFFDVFFYTKLNIHISYRCSSKHSIKMHIINTHVCTQQAVEMCYICAKVYKSKGTLEIHMLQKHNSDPNRPKWECNTCGAW